MEVDADDVLEEVAKMNPTEACHYGTFSARLRHTILDELVAPNGGMVASAGARV